MTACAAPSSKGEPRRAPLNRRLLAFDCAPLVTCLQRPPHRRLHPPWIADGREVPEVVVVEHDLAARRLLELRGRVHVVELRVVEDVVHLPAEAQVAFAPEAEIL